ncbi:MAG: hypothetical protein KTQ13_02525 [Ferruginibacter sp.]|nr:hypothetical protein [Chitinophagaceae bacterium]MBP6286545.1 hypothetical protein [Ferruginibacter sp.]MBU9935499.1 hypothetical protein [Ferruginibacter sp.]HQY11810.1 hypothetical protein [Ferruginibacter sp.]
MKKQSENTITVLSKKDVQHLVNVVKETISRPRTFSAAELWDIQRRGRTMVSRRNYAF